MSGQDLKTLPPGHPARCADVLEHMQATAGALDQYHLETIKEALLTCAGAWPMPVEISYDRARDVLTIAGVKYAPAVFQNLGIAPNGQWFRIIGREADGVLTLYTDPTIGTDADRYRWIRQGDNDELVVRRGPLTGPFLLRREQLDEAIDKHMDRKVVRLKP